MRRSAIAGLAGGMLAGCMVGPDYVKPKVEAPAAYVYEPTADGADRQHGMVEAIRRSRAR